MSNIVQGKNIIVYLLYDGQYWPVFCAKTASVVQNQESFEVTSVDSGNDREYEPGMSTTTLDISGVTSLNNSYSKISILFLMQLSQRRQVQTMRVTLTDNDGNAVNVGFDAIIVTNSFDKSLGGAMSQSSTSLLVTGGIIISPTIDSPGVAEVQEALYIDCVEGASSVQDDLLKQAGVEILHADRTGTGLVQVVGTPAAGTRQFKFTAASGTIETDATVPYNAGEIIYVLYQI